MTTEWPTPAMIEAGAREYCAIDERLGDPEDFVVSIYRAMEAARPSECERTVEGIERLRALHRNTEKMRARVEAMQLSRGIFPG